MNLDLIIESPDTVHAQIERFLRNQMLTGKLQPGELLPSTAALAKHWRVHKTTIQTAMAPLVREGLIYRKPRRGTFVRAGNRQGVIGVLMRSKLTDETAYFQRAMLRSIQSEIHLRQDAPWSCRYYDGLADSPRKTDNRQSPACRQFISDFKNNPFKGFIQITSGIANLKKLIPDLNLPVVRLGLCLTSPEADVVLDYGCFAEEAITLVARQGARNIVYLCVNSGTSDIDGLDRGIKAAGLPQPFIFNFPKKSDGSTVEQDAYTETLRMLRQWRKANRWPDAMIISDDIATRGAALALVGNACPESAKIQVVTLAHEGVRHLYGIPVVQYVFSPATIAQELLHILNRRMAGEALPPLPVIIKGRLDFSMNKQ